MSQSHSADLDVWNREEFEELLSELLTNARANDVHVEGTYQTWSHEGCDLEVEIKEVFERGHHQVPEPGKERKPNDVGPVDVTTRASLVQLLTGFALTEDESDATCGECEEEIRNGTEVTVCCREPLDEFRWTVRDVFCRDCKVRTIPSPSFGRTDVLVAATVADIMDASEQTIHQVMNNVRLVDYSPPPEGSI